MSVSAASAASPAARQAAHWRIDRDAFGPGVDALSFGCYQLAIDDIADVTAEEVTYRPRAGLWASAVVVAACSAVIAWGGFEAGVRSGALLCCSLLAVLGFMGLTGRAALGVQRDYEAHILLKSGRIITFLSKDMSEVVRLMARIGQRR